MIDKNSKISLSQYYSLLEVWIRPDEHIKSHWDMISVEKVLKNITEKQKSLLIALLVQKKYLKINKGFEEWGIKRNLHTEQQEENISNYF